ncbi:LysR family transcriptional regulator [Limosilactobacillus caecicola]|uniref:LysR family transcriptional regulator n=1 Tax=Limosilactobacillus caecicola TaxID=2941332 RepID=UPI00203F17CD|nr:LysR family transcriptional regulator [Limosilactobacillus caecicola]
MIENYLLEELATFAECGTLTKTAEKLMMTQPTITRGLQKLENEFGVQLFDRQPNRITLTKAGQMAAEGAAQLLQDNQQLVERVQNFATSQRVITITSTAPGPLLLAQNLTLPHLKTASVEELTTADQVSDLLNNRQATIVLTQQELQTDEIESLFVGKEHLEVNLDQFTYQANQQQITFKELAGLSFVVLSDIGPWNQVIQEHIPDAKFLYQSEMTALQEITQYSNFPYFTTNITDVTGHEEANTEDRKKIPITDESATMEFFAAYRIEDRKFVQPILKSLSQEWPDPTN